MISSRFFEEKNASLLKEPDFKCDFWVCKLHSIPITGGVLDKQHEQKFIKKEPLLWFFRVKNCCAAANQCQIGDGIIMVFKCHPY